MAEATTPTTELRATDEALAWISGRLQWEQTLGRLREPGRPDAEVHAIGAPADHDARRDEVTRAA